MSQESKDGFSALRQEIDRIDHQLLDTLAERRQVALSIIQAKARGELPLRDQSREERLLMERIEAGQERGLSAHYVTRIFHEVIDDSLRLQRSVLQDLANSEPGGERIFRVASLGIEGSYSHLAARASFARRNARVSAVPCQSFREIIQAVEEGRADYGVLPIENTNSGGINEVYDLLLHTRLSIVGEHKLEIDHCLLGLPGASREEVEVLHSHPQPLEQCSAFVAGLGNVRREIASDTASAVKQVAKLGDPKRAAIGSSDAGRLYGLEPLAEGIANHSSNFTRFLIVAPRPINVDLRIPAKTSVVIATSQRAGALVEALLVFRDHGFNLTKLESRPILGNPWEEMFYVDIEGNTADPRLMQALDELERFTRSIRVLGTYPSDDVPATRVPIDGQ